MRPGAGHRDLKTTGILNMATVVERPKVSVLFKGHVVLRFTTRPQKVMGGTCLTLIWQSLYTSN